MASGKFSLSVYVLILIALLEFEFFLTLFVLLSFCFVCRETKKTEEGESELSTRYKDALDALSSLITKRSRFVNSNQSHRFHLLFHYLKVPN